MSFRRSAARKYGLRTVARRLNEHSTSSSDSPQSPTDTTDQVVSNSGGTDGRNRVRQANNRSLPSPLDQIDPRRWKHFPRFSTTSDFATFPFSDIDVSEEEAHLSADEHSIIGIKSSLQEHGSKGQNAAVSTPETRIRNAAAGIRRAVSDGSDKIKKMTLKLRRAPSTFLNRSRSRVFNSQSSPTTQSECHGFQCSNLSNSRQKKATETPQPSEIQLRHREDFDAKELGSIDRTSSDVLSIASCTVTPWHTPSRVRCTTEDKCKDRPMSDQKLANASQFGLHQMDNPCTQNKGMSPLARAERMCESQRNSLMDRLASYPQESLAWLAKDSLVNDPPGPLSDSTNIILHELSGQRHQDRSKVYSFASGMTERPLLDTKVSLPELDTHVVSSESMRVPKTFERSRTHSHDTKGLAVCPRMHQIHHDTDDSPAAKHSMDMGDLFKNKTNSGRPIKFDEDTPTETRPSLRRTVSRIFRGGTPGANNENQKP